jgi:hypothetical protein
VESDASAVEPKSGRPLIRYEATLHPGSAGGLDESRIAYLDLDRVPDPKGRFRVLIDPEQVQALVNTGVEVRLHRVAPVQPLHPRLVVEDAEAREWLDRRLEGIEHDPEGGA